jgi:hypothetical protein
MSFAIVYWICIDKIGSYDGGNLREKALKAYEGIFNKMETIEINGYMHHMEYTSIQGLRKYNIDGYNYIEQNPDKNSNWAKMAREGHKIMWVMKGSRYLADFILTSNFI